jgi:hypothetical protein
MDFDLKSLFTTSDVLGDADEFWFSAGTDMLDGFAWSVMWDRLG